MKITRIEAVPVRIPFRRTYEIASGSIPAGQNVIIRIFTDQGPTGLGEASPIASTDADTQRSIVEAVTNRIAARLIGKDPLELPRLLAAVQGSMPGNHCAKAGVDIGLHDLAGRILGVPVYQLLGGRFHSQIDMQEADIWIDTPANMASAAADAFARGVRAFEIKIGTSPSLDVERVRAVREAVGSGAKLRVDCNEGYAAGTALKALRKMEAFDLEYMEQPLPRWDFEGMAQLAACLDTPICADQAAYTPHDVFRLLAMAAADLVCIKIPKSGLQGAQAIHAICEAAGVKCTLGSMLPLGIGAAAIHHFGVHARNVDLQMSGIYGNALDYFLDDIVTASTIDADGVVRLADAPGLGVTLDEEKLGRYAIS